MEIVPAEAAEVDVVLTVSSVVLPIFVQPPLPPVYVPSTDHIFPLPLEMEMVVPLFMFSADKLVCETPFIVCAPVKYRDAAMVWSDVDG